MTSLTDASSSIAEATALLQAELPQLEQHQQTLEMELASVTERLESVRSALTALQALSSTAIPAPREALEKGEVTAMGTPAAAEDATSEPVPSEEPMAAPVPEAAPAARTARKPATSPRPRKRTAKQSTGTAPKQRRAEKTAPAQPAKAKKASGKGKDAGPGLQDASGLTDRVVAVLSRNADTPLRARDVAQALGRDDTTGNINTVRSTLDRLVATSRAHRAGRGLYQAPVN